jgi:prepilin peptidase CpaA
MQTESFEIALIVALVGLLVIASVTDWRRREIDNWLNISIAAGAPLFWLATGLSLWPDMAIQLGLGLVVFAIFTGFFALGAMGGGDVKLLGALALWFAPFPMLRLLLAMSILGGVLTLFMLVRQKALKLPGKPEIPYGIAIAIAALWVIYERYLNHF